MELIEKYARLLAALNGEDPDEERSPETLLDWELVRAGKPLPKNWMNYAAEAMSTLAALPANVTLPSLPR